MKHLLTVILVFLITLPSYSMANKVLSAEGATTGASTHVPLVAIAKAVSDAGVAEIQVTDGNTLTKTLISIATGKTDMGVLPIAAINLMNVGKGPYEKLPEAKRKAIKSKLRSLFGYQAGYYTFLTFDDSGIKNWEDIKGKKVFVGPPSGAASNNSIALIEAATGFKPNVEYEAVKMGWGAVMQAFTDRKIDAMMRPGPWPNAMFSQLQASGKLRIIGMTDRVLQGKVANRNGFSPLMVETSQLGDGNFVFSNEKDGKVGEMAYQMSVAVSTDMNETLAYNITKAFFERYDEAMKIAAWMPNLQINKVVTGLEGVDLKLHPGAVKYYMEAGYSIPDALK